LIFGAIRAELLHYMIYSLAEYVTCTSSMASNDVKYE
jgi:hypothetical protein